jgi:hypothetical protein
MDKYLKKSTRSDKDSKIDDKLKTINIIINMYPQLKKDRQDIINTVYEKLSKPTTYVFTKILLDNKEYYVDSEGIIMTKTLEFKGIVINNTYYMAEND